MHFRYFAIFFIFPWKRACPFIQANLSPVHQKRLYAKFGGNEHTRSRDENFQISSMQFCYHILEKLMTLQLNKIESYLFNDAFGQVW